MVRSVWGGWGDVEFWPVWGAGGATRLAGSPAAGDRVIRGSPSERGGSFTRSWIHPHLDPNPVPRRVMGRHQGKGGEAVPRPSGGARQGGTRPRAGQVATSGGGLACQAGGMPGTPVPLAEGRAGGYAGHSDTRRCDDPPFGVLTSPSVAIDLPRGKDPLPRLLSVIGPAATRFGPDRGEAPGGAGFAFLGVGAPPVWLAGEGPASGTPLAPLISGWVVRPLVKGSLTLRLRAALDGYQLANVIGGPSHSGEPDELHE
jgi:hypothetical protein